MSETWEETKARLRKLGIKTNPLPKIIEPVIVPKAMEIPTGDFYAVFKRSNKGANHRVLMSLPRTEALFWTTVFNEREVKKRENLPEPPEVVWFFDCVLEGTNQEDIYWNPSEIVQGEN